MTRAGHNPARNGLTRARTSAGRNTAYTTANTAIASPASSSSSSLRKACQVTRSPRMTPSRARRKVMARQTMKGIRNWPVRSGWPFTWLTMPGANPANSPPTSPAGQDPTMCRDSTWYQAHAVAASPPVSMTVNATAGPNSRVTGTSGTVRPSRPVLATRFTPFGAFS